LIQILGDFDPSCLNGNEILSCFQGVFCQLVAIFHIVENGRLRVDLAACIHVSAWPEDKSSMAIQLFFQIAAEDAVVVRGNQGAFFHTVVTLPVDQHHIIAVVTGEFQ